MSGVHSSLQKVFEKEGKTKIGKCNHPTPEAYNSWQKVPKKEAKYKIEKKQSYT